MLRYEPQSYWLAFVSSEGRQVWGVRLQGPLVLQVIDDALTIGNKRVLVHEAQYGDRANALLRLSQFSDEVQASATRPEGQTPPPSSPATRTGTSWSRPSTSQSEWSSSQSAATRRANTAAGLVEAAAWFALCASIVLGFSVARRTVHNLVSGETEHPYIATGIGIAFAGSFQALVVIMIAAYIKARTE